MQIALRWLSWLIKVLLDKSGCRHIRRTLIWQRQSGVLPRQISILQFHFSRSSPQHVVRGEWVFLGHLFERRGRYLIKETLRHHYTCGDLVQLTHASIILHYYLLLIILFIVPFCKLKPIILTFLCFPFLLLLLIVWVLLLWVISRGLRWQLIVCIAIGVGNGCDR
jgi:hypothetical protein